MKNTKDEFANLLALFLAEQLRNKKITLKHTADVIEKFMQNVNLINNEEHYLSFIKELSKDFEVLSKFEERIKKKIFQNEQQEFESVVREFVGQLLSSQQALAHEFLKAALEEGADSETLMKKFPEFKSFLDSLPNSRQEILHHNIIQRKYSET